MAWWGGYGGWPEYVPVATKVARAKKAAEKLRKKGVDVQPVELSGRKIASSFWGKGWCDHMDSYHDYENRLPRGRSYVRNGSVVHLEVSKGEIHALVAGSKTYAVDITVGLLPAERWKWIKERCAGQIASLLDLLKGSLSDGVMRVVTDRDNGLFPGPKEFRMRCSCPDGAVMCKHIAAVFYGIGNRLDSRPELLFLLRGVDHAELATDGGVDAVIARGGDGAPQLAGADLSEMFGIELVEADAVAGSGGAVKAAPPAVKPSKKSKPARPGRPQRAAGSGKKQAVQVNDVPEKAIAKKTTGAAKPKASARRAKAATTAAAATGTMAAAKSRARSSPAKAPKPSGKAAAARGAKTGASDEDARL
ncbi:MAG: SWIM zinc finger family protein, partial [Planctomycetota bacterium]|nr:SWIM zinc finger family protein [Planctomycetota bacterium]